MYAKKSIILRTEHSTTTCPTVSSSYNRDGRSKAWLILVVGSLAAVAWLAATWLRPRLKVETKRVWRGPLAVTIREDGKTRIKDRYVISSPLTGKLVRIELDPGNAVCAKQTVAAIVRPTVPSLLDSRQEKQAQALEKAAQLRVDQAKALESQVSTQLQLAESTYERLKKLGNSVAQQDLQQAEAEYQLQTSRYSSAQIATRIAEFELAQAQAALLHVVSESDDSSEATMSDFVVYSPIDGKVLRIFQESAAIVQAGTPLLELGDPNNLEVLVDVLSNQAVRMAPGNRVLIDRWGGDHPLQGIVRRIEPAGFTKISALGVEEQRVNVIVDLTEPPTVRPTLGDAYRVEAEVTVWQAEDVVQVPVSSLFRQQDDWAVFVFSQGKLKIQRIELGHRSSSGAEVFSGISEGDEVVLHPNDELREGMRAEAL